MASTAEWSGMTSDEMEQRLAMLRRMPAVALKAATARRAFAEMVDADNALSELVFAAQDSLDDQRWMRQRFEGLLETMQRMAEEDQAEGRSHEASTTRVWADQIELILTAGRRR
jgi:hypothetical protein